MSTMVQVGRHQLLIHHRSSCRTKRAFVCFSSIVICFILIFISATRTSLQTPKDVGFEKAHKEGKQFFSNKPSGQSTAPRSPLALFYNIYIPSKERRHRKGTDEGVRNAIDIVREQLQQIGATKAASYLTLYYTTIGDRALNATYMSRLCFKYNTSCLHLGHFESGYEEVTLGKMYQFCQIHEAHRVIYVHNKGSFNPRQVQGFWRRHGTAAAMSDLCLQPANDECNVCGLLFSPLPFPQFPGNFWGAKCSYVKQLVPPKKYWLAKRIFYTEVKIPMQQQNKTVSKLFQENPVSLGGKRYAMEQWIGSHPSVVPCDLSNRPDIDYWQNTNRNESEFKWSLAPRHDLRSMLERVNGHESSVLDSDFDRMRDYFLLPGTILRWQALYHAVPASASWVWSFYPDGDVWREAVEKYGDQAVQVLTKACLSAKDDCLKAVSMALRSAEAVT